MKKIFGVLLCLTAVLFIFMSFPQKTYAKDADGDIVIIVDPGHGSVDGGANKNGVREETANWAIATSLKAELETYWGVKVYLTRGSSEYNSNSGRGRHGLGVNADFVISVHNNSGVAEAKGIEVYGTVNPNYSKVTTAIGTKICEKVSALGLVNRGYKTRPSGGNPARDYYTVIDEAVLSGVPAIIVEHCFLSNPSDAAFIADLTNCKKVGAADATAIAEYFGLAKRGVTDGSNITLTRTYSANFVTSARGTFESSDTKVAMVNTNGVITAIGEGSATITNTLSDGKVETVTISVPAVKMVAVSAGISPTYYDPDEEINNADIFVKAIYSDGSAKQVSGYVLGTPKISEGVYDYPITYEGFSCILRVYKTGRVGTYSAGATYKPGNNTDIVLVPEVYQSVNTGINISLSPVSSEYVGVTGNPQIPEVKPTEPATPQPTTPQPTTPEPTTPEVTTPAPTTQEETEAGTTTEEITSSEEAATEEGSESVTQESTTKDNSEESVKPQMWQIFLIIGIGVVGIAAGAAAIIVFFKLRR